MTAPAATALPVSGRSARHRQFLMCPPLYFDVTYAINRWMNPAVPVDRDRALRQWTALVATYRRYGHQVDLLDPVPGLVDMVFTANGATVVDGRVLQAKFATAHRQSEAEIHRTWHRANGVDRQTYGRPAAVAVPVTAPTAVNEGEGDFAVLSDRILAGYGFRTSRDAHRELATLTAREVVSLELVDPRFYHLDVALTVLDDRAGHVAYYPPAFSPASLQILRRLYPDAILATEADALLLGLNCVSDGRNVFVPAGAGHLIGELGAAGYSGVPVDLSELALAGGSIKCCTQEIRTAEVHDREIVPPPTPSR